MFSDHEFVLQKFVVKDYGVCIMNVTPINK
jgi:hypothetical protein